MSGIDFTAYLADLRALIAASSEADVVTMRDNGRIAWPGEPFQEPEPTGDDSSPMFWLDVDFGWIEGGGDTFGTEIAPMNLDLAVCVENGNGAYFKCMEIVDAIKASFQSQNTASMQYYPERLWIADEGEWGDRWYRVDPQIPIERREAI